MGRLKKGEAFTLSTVITAVILLIMLVFLAYWINKTFFGIDKATTCEPGICTDRSSGCKEGYYPIEGRKCQDSQKCCYPIHITPGEETRFTAEQRTAIANPVYMTLGKNPQSLEALNLKEGQSYDFNLKFNDKLPPSSFHWFLIYVYDSKKPEDVLYFEGTPAIGGPDSGLIALTEKDALWEKILFQKDNSQHLKENTFSINYKPSLKDSYKSLNLKVVLVDLRKVICKEELSGNYETSNDVQSEKWIKCLTADLTEAQKSKIATFNSKFASLSNENKLGVYLDPAYLLASKEYPLKVSRVLDISGLGSSWASEDTVTLSLSDAEYGSLGLRLVNADTLNGFDELVGQCEQYVQPSDFVYTTTNIVGTTIETSGIDLGLNIGGFRVPTSSSQLKYLTQEKKISISKGKVDVKIDKATMIKDFYELNHDEKLFIGENTFLCAIAKKGTSYAHAVSTTPIKVDVLPPSVTQETVQIVYADPVQNTEAYSKQYLSIAGQNYFYKQYPRVIISCQDYGQSGCSSYDYYLKTGNYVDVRVNSDNVEGAITGVALQFGLNQLFDYFAKKDPLKTICPQPYSNEFRTNTKPIISLRTTGQGIICIRVKDKAGNVADIVWKEILTPQEMIKQVAIEAADEAENASD